MSVFDNVNISLIVLCILLIFIDLYHNNYYPKSPCHEHIDIDIPGANVDVKDLLIKVIKKEKKTVVDKAINACKTGIAKGAVMGCFSGSITGIITSAALFGVINPIMTCYEHV
jgi:hypothetical protein